MFHSAQDARQISVPVLTILISLVFCFLAGAPSVSGFGQNKVQYTQMNWNFYSLPHFNAYFHQRQGDLPQTTARLAESAYLLLQKDLGSPHSKPIPLIVFGSPQLFEQTNVILDIIPEGVGGFTEFFKNRIVIPYSGSYAEYSHVLHHELVHAFQFAILFDNIGNSLIRSAAVQLPLWFTEGSAEYLSSGWNCAADMFMMDQAVFGSIPPPGPELDGYMAYKGGQSFFHFLEGSRGDSAFHDFLQSFCRSKKPETAMKRVYYKDQSALGEEWLQELKRIYWPEIGKRVKPDELAAAVTGKPESKSYFNLKARISPNGKRIAFFSDLRDYTRILVTDRSGKITAEIRQYGYGGYFESFDPFRSGLCWGPNNDQIAFVTKNKGRNEIRIVNVDTKKLIQTIHPDLTGVTAPDWSADGKNIIFYGLNEDRSDLYLYNIESSTLKRLTNDARFETDPRFSHDGRLILFAAQDSTGVCARSNQAQQPAFDLFTYRISDGAITRLTSTPWNEKQAAFSPDGSQIAFISDRNGINNIYLSTLNAPESAKALTDFIGGCSDPDWARDTNTLVFTLFQKQRWNVWLVDQPTAKLHDSAIAPTQWRMTLDDPSLSFYKKRAIVKDTTLKFEDEYGIREDDTLIEGPLSIFHPRPAAPKKKPGKSAIAETIDTAHADTAHRAPRQDTLQGSGPATKGTLAVISDTSSTVATRADTSAAHDTLKNQGAVAGTTDTTRSLPGANPVSHPYRLAFSPDMVSVGLAAMPLYGYSGGGMIILSDLLGDHRIALSGSLQGNLDEFDLFGMYLNSTHRINFSLGALFNRYLTYEGLIGYSLFRDTNYGFMLGARYPFSLFSRLDLNCYYRHMKREPYKIHNGRSLVRDPEREGYVLNVTLPALSYVFDNILWGITGPVNGIRGQANLIVSPSFNRTDAAFVSFDCDLRKYFHFAKKFVWANKIAFGASQPINRANSARRYFLGGNENWYNYFSYGINDSVYENNMRNFYYSEFIVPFRGWRYFDFSGTRFAVINTEFRFPFVKNITLVWPLPMELRYITGAFFIDAGNAWNADQQIEGLPLPDQIFGGFGFGLRANLGIFVMRWDMAWPTDWRLWAGKPVHYISLGAEF
jgi:Tol biopolymer transport system component